MRPLGSTTTDDRKQRSIVTTSFQTQSAAPTVVSLHKRPLPQTEFVDRDGDVWVVSGHTVAGELIMSCPAPSHSADAGDGVSFPWTLREVQAAFGPLMARSAGAA
jgi:hypothetical protein